MKLNLLLLLAVTLLLGVGCASSVNMKNVEIHYNAGRNFEQQGDPQSAKDQYAKALINAKLANGNPALISMLTYNYGRMLGHTCQYEEAEENLIEALNMEKAITGNNSGPTSMRLFELARLNYDNNQFRKAASYFEEGIPLIESLNIEQSDPIGYTLILKIYKSSLDMLDRKAEADQIQIKIDSLLASNPEKSPGFTPLSYKCN